MGKIVGQNVGHLGLRHLRYQPQFFLVIMVILYRGLIMPSVQILMSYEIFDLGLICLFSQINHFRILLVNRVFLGFG